MSFIRQNPLQLFRGQHALKYQLQQSRSLASSNEGKDYTTFEVNRPQDAVPFSYDNKFTFALKLAAFTAAGLMAPVGIIWWQM